jgi:hypothetical protein
MFSFLNCNDEDNVNDYILTARIPSSMSVQIIQTPHGFSLTAAHQFAPGMRVLNLTGITKTTKDRYSIQTSLDEHLHPFDELQSNPDDCQTPWIYTNHSCNPNVVIRGLSYIALREIQPEESITFDYETTELEMAEPFTCACQAETCRGLIRGFRHLSKLQRSALVDQTVSYLLTVPE